MAIPLSRRSTAARETSALLSRVARSGGIIDLSPATRYAIAIGAAVFALLLRVALEPVLGVRFPYVTLFPAIMLSAWLGGLGPGAVTTLLSGIGAAYFWNDAAWTRDVADKGELVGVVLFVGVGGTISLLNEVWRRAARAVAHSEERLRTTLHSIGDAVITTDERGDITAVNAVAEAMTGWREADAVGQPLQTVFAILNEDSRQPAENRVPMALRDDKVAGLGSHTILVSRDGKETPIDDSVAAIKRDDGGVGGAVLVFRDITEQRRAERERASLLEREQRSQANLAYELARMMRLQSVSARMTQAGDMQALLQEILAASAELTGTDKGNIQFLNAETGKLRIVIHQGLGPRLVEHFAEDGWTLTCDAALQQAQRVIIEDVSKEPTVQGTLGLEIVLEDGIRGIQSTPIVSSTGRLLGMLNNHFRIVHRPSDSDLRYVDLLARMAADLIERAQAQRALRDADRRKDEFLATLAHELRNPLAPIRTGLELIRVTGDSAESVARVRHMIERQVEHMVRLIDDLLELSRIASGKILLKREPTPLSAIIDGAIEATRAQMGAKQLALAVEVPDTPCVLDVDPLRFIQVLSNLLHNAAKFTGVGGSVRVSANVRESDKTGAPELLLSVGDSGAGIGPEFLPHVFDLFAQEHRVSEGGLGIGLALTRQLVEMHGGQIEAKSPGLGQGSVFTIHLPLSTQPSATPTSREAVAIDAAGRNILVIDDNRDATNTMAMLVEALGGTCRTAYDGPTGISEARDFRPDLVLLDIGMPGMDGYETCRRLRQELGTQTTLVAVSGFGQEHDKARAVLAGFDTHLTKPVDPSVLISLFSNSKRGEGGRGEGDFVSAP